MSWPEIWAAVKLMLTALPAEVNLIAVEQIAWKIFEAGWTKGSFLTALIADANEVFPDARSRAFIVVVLQAMLDLVTAAVVKPVAP